MKLPFLNAINKVKNQTVTFKGLNRTVNVSDGEMTDMCGLSSRNFPILSPRKTRGSVTSGLSTECTYIKDNYAYYFLENGNVEVERINGASSIAFIKSAWCGGIPLYIMFYNNNFLVFTDNKVCLVPFYPAENGFTEAELTNSLDFPVIHDNRIWAVNNTNHEICASKLGDALSWQTYDGLASDSYTASVGTEGDFTGAYSFGGYVYCFKEYVIHRVYGSQPSNFQIVNFTAYGVKNGAYKSMAECDGYLFYLSPAGIARFDGNSVNIISDALGDGDKISVRSAGVYNHKYYFCGTIQNETTYKIYCYDTKTGLWHIDSIDEGDFIFTDSRLYLNAQSKSGYTLWLIDMGTMREFYGDDYNPNLVYTTNSEKPVRWYGVFAPTLEGSFDKKILSKIQLHMDLDNGTQVEIFIRYDNEPDFTRLCTFKGNGRGTRNIPIIPRRNERFEIKIEGIGEAKIYGYTRSVTYGSEV